MADKSGSRWLQALPWSILGRNTAYQPDLGTSPAELVFGAMPRLPGELIDPEPGVPLDQLLDTLRTKAARDPTPTSHHRELPVHLPQAAMDCTHVWVKIGKPKPLGPLWEGPYPIIERIGKSVLKVRVGNWASGQPRHELQHWNNCFPSPAGVDHFAEKAKRGRKLNPKAAEFAP